MNKTPFFTHTYATVLAKFLTYCLLNIVLCLYAVSPALSASPHDDTNALDFSIFHLGSGDPVILVVGGIQGDEPGGFSAATLLATRYTVTKGSLWIVPNLNFPSIIRRSRGIWGDMNRKFAILDAKDPQFHSVSRIQELIRAPEVRLVLNLHDGSGFYCPTYKNKLRNPKRWGQSVIIDQSFMPNVPKPNKDYNTANPTEKLHYLEALAQEVVCSVNKHLIKPDHSIAVHNTHTAKGDVEMEKSLSWYAVRHGKAAFGVEASKEFSVAGRTYYHLHMIEAFAHAVGIEMERDFPLTFKGVSTALQSGLSVHFVNNRISLPLEDVRRHINFFPLPLKDYAPVTSKPIMAVLPKDKTLRVHYGNRTLTTISPEWRDMDYSLNNLRVIVDGKEQEIAFGQIVPVKKHFNVLLPKEYRCNAIGANTGKDNEAHMNLERASFIKRFSVDNSGSVFRVEIYRGKKFCGMFLVRFGHKNS